MKIMHRGRLCLLPFKTAQNWARFLSKWKTALLRFISEKDYRLSYYAGLWKISDETMHSSSRSTFTSRLYSRDENQGLSDWLQAASSTSRIIVSYRGFAASVSIT